MPEETAYPVVIDGRMGVVLLYRHLTPVEGLDFQNRITQEVRDGRNRWSLERAIDMPQQHCIAFEGNNQLVYVFEDGVQYYRLFRPRDFTELIVAFEVDDIDNLTEEEKKLHERILDQFITAYRAFTGDIGVRMPDDLFEDYPLIRMGRHEYTEEELRFTEIERLRRLRTMDMRIEGLPFGINLHLLTPPQVDPERVGPIISAFLRTGETIPRPQATLIKAAEELKIGHNYRYAFLLASFVIEEVVTEFLEDIKRRAGVSDRAIEAYRGEIGIAYKIKVELPLILPQNHPIRRLIPEMTGVNSIRNDVVHRARVPTFQEAGNSIQIADRLIKSLAGEPDEPEAPAAPPPAAPAPAAV